MNAMFPANKDVYSPQRHQDGIPVVVVAQERGDEEREEDGNGPGKKQPRETHLSTGDVFQLHFKNTDSKFHKHWRKPKEPIRENHLLHANICQD